MSAGIAVKEVPVSALFLIIIALIAIGIIINQTLWFVGGLAIARSDAAHRRSNIIFVFAHFLDGDRLSAEYEKRCEAALALYTLSPRPIMVAGGTTKGSSVSQAEAAKRWFIQHDVDERLIILPSTENWEVDSHDTLVECRLLVDEMNWQGWASCVFVTNPLQAIQVYYALLRLGATGYAHCTDLQVTSWKYRFVRWAIILPTLMDPYGSMFAPLRFLRRRVTGKAI
jgi:uncharacterized SAM-binding protein YcdF (DUF218 family)